MKYVFFDIETNAIKLDDVSIIHCIAYKIWCDEVRILSDKFEEFVKLGEIDKETVFVGHNIISYDIPIIKKFYPNFNPLHVVDT
jgi:uncharacterized protein YprB with RNaseH-like and TPR domain